MDAMSREPVVSVVLSVFNDASRVRRAAMSILEQTFEELELIAIDDGSTDGSGDLLEELARSDSRVRVIRQRNTGLTRALARGCGEARGVYVARQDAGDWSHPGRIAEQVQMMRSAENVVLTACGTSFCGPGGELLFQVARSGRALRQGLDRLVPGELVGPPHHGACMFAREAYARAGGYRPEFVFAQDIDLWLRLAELGDCVGSEGMRYNASVDFGGISQRSNDRQHELAALAIGCAVARRRGEPEDDMLASARSVQSPPASTLSITVERARYHYFVARNLCKRDPPGARRYFLKSLADDPFHIGAIVGFVRSFL